MAGLGQAIPDIHIGRAYDRRDPECDVHYETFGRLADFFGRNTPPHRHYCFFQVHFLVQGSIRLNLDGQVYSGRAPLLIFTPPTLPHSFYTEEDTDGHVLTVRQEIVRAWFQAMPGQWPDARLREPAFLEFSELADGGGRECETLVKLADLLHGEFFGDGPSTQYPPGRATALLALGECFFIVVSRLLRARATDAPARQERREDLRLFLKFCDLIELHFREHLTLSDYARHLAITEARLNDICRRMAGRASKDVAHERLFQEARRMLRFSGVPVSEIAYQLGFADPAYFSRFFAKRAGLPPSQFRADEQASGQNGQA